MIRTTVFHVLRIIPADAGSTISRFTWTGLPEDHPRGCGEHRSLNRRLGLVMWIIPADAGSTPSKRYRLSPRWDHPRGCGEHAGLQGPGCQGRGSSPRMRGARSLCDSVSRDTRIIPADAGSTIVIPCMPKFSQDHPRGCGEHHTTTTLLQPSSGSSPRMRGALGVQSHGRRVSGIIPADAGSTDRHHP